MHITTEIIKHLGNRPSKNYIISNGSVGIPAIHSCTWKQIDLLKLSMSW